MSERGTGHSQLAAVLLEKGGKFYFYQPGTSVIASGDTIETAYGKFLDARHDFLTQVESAGLQVDAAGLTVGEPAGPMTVEARIGRRGAFAELALFLAKTCIVLMIIGGITATVVVRAASGIAEAVDHALKPVSTISLADISHKAADIVKDAQSLTKEQRESLRLSIGTISREIEPYVEAWRNPPTATQPNSNPEAAPAKNSTGR